MKINNTNINIFGARQHRVEYGHQGVKFSNEWTPGTVLPYMGTCNVDFKQLTVTLVLKGATRTQILNNRSALLAILTEPVIIELDNNPHYFYGVLRSHKETEVVKQRWHTMELSFDCYEYGATVTASGNTSFTITNPGNVPSPCVVTITPGISASKITLTGICVDPLKGTDLPVEIPDVETGKTIIIDGETGLILQNGSLKEMYIWALPALKPGVTTITCDNRLMTVSVSVKPLYF